MISKNHVPPEDLRERRALVRGRKRLVEKRTDFKNVTHALVDEDGISYDWDPFSEQGRELLADAGEELSISPVGQQLLDSFLSVIDELTAHIKAVEGRIEEVAASLEATQLLMTILGVTFYSSLLITSELGEIGRFDTYEEVLSFAGLDPTVHMSRDSQTVLLNPPTAAG